MKLKTRPCLHCNGTGQEIDPFALGQTFRAKRMAAGVSLREMARRLDITPAYLSDMERGSRMLQDQYQKAYAKL